MHLFSIVARAVAEVLRARLVYLILHWHESTPHCSISRERKQGCSAHMDSPEMFWMLYGGCVVPAEALTRIPLHSALKRFRPSFRQLRSCWSMSNGL